MHLLRRNSGHHRSGGVNLLRGSVEVVLIEGRNMAIRDSCGTSDPYVVLRVGEKKCTSTVKYKTLNPVWNEKFTFDVHGDETLHCDAWDKDKILRDDPLGNVSVNLREHVSTQPKDVWVSLTNVECGELHFQIFYRTFADDLQKSFQAIEMVPLKIKSMVATPLMWTQAADCKKALAAHLASLVNNEEWADVEFVLDADNDKRIYAHSVILASRCQALQVVLPKPTPRPVRKGSTAAAVDTQISGEFGFTRKDSPRLETLTGLSSSRSVPTTESESKHSKRKQPRKRARVLVKDHKADVFLAAMHFLYTGSIPREPCFGYTLRKQEDEPKVEAEEVKAPTKSPVKWSWFSDPDWAEYDPDLNEEIEKAFQQATQANDGNSIKVRVDAERFVEVKTGVTSWYQKRYDDENRVRAVKREDPSTVDTSTPAASSSSSSASADMVSQFNDKQLAAKNDLDFRIAKVAFEYLLPELRQAFVLKCEETIRYGHYDNELPANVVADLARAIQNTDYGQVTVVVADDADESVHHEVLAHPCFLALSPFFRAILQSGMKEAQEKRIELTEITRECFLLVLEFLHTGVFAEFPSEYALEMLRISDQYDISPLLRQMIETFISVHILDKDNAIAIYHYAVLNSAQSLEAAAIQFLRLTCYRDNGWVKKNRELLATLSESALKEVEK